MTITVVTSRADDGAPATRDVYTAAVGYTTVNGNLEVSSANRMPLAFYGSGNWLSVYVGDSVTLISAGADCPSDASSVVDGPLPTPEVEHVAAGCDSSADAPDDVADTERAVEAPVRPAADHDDTPAGREDSPAGTSERERTQPRRMMRVAIRPRTNPQPPPDVQAVAPGRSRMRTVAFRAKTYAQRPRGAEPEHARNPRMRTVTVRPKTYVPPQTRGAPPGGVDDRPGRPDAPD